MQTNQWTNALACNIQYVAGGSEFAVMAPKSVLTFDAATNTYSRCPIKAPPGNLFRPIGMGVVGQVSTYLGLIFLLFVAIRSTSSRSWDFYRIMAMYIVGTIGVPLSIMIAYLVGIEDPGFNRIFGYGIIAHNFSEIFILGAWWAGTQGSMWHNTGFWVSLTYLVAMLIFISSLSSLPVLLVILMTLGAGLDFSMLITYSYVGCRCSGVTPKKYSYFGWAIAAALIHLGIVEILFLGILQAQTNLFVTSSFVPLLPNFLMYMYFAELDTKWSHWARMFGPKLDYRHKKDGDDVEMAAAIENGDAKSAGDELTDPLSVGDENAPMSLIRQGILFSGDPMFPNPWTAFYAVVGAGFGASLVNSLVFLFLPCYANPPIKC